MLKATEDAYRLDPSDDVPPKLISASNIQLERKQAVPLPSWRWRTAILLGWQDGPFRVHHPPRGDPVLQGREESLEINVVAHVDAAAIVPELAAIPDNSRYMAMHARFFRLLAAVGRLKEARRAVYRTVAGLKKSWFGYVAQRKADLAAKHDAVVVTEDLDILAVPTDDPTYKGRTFNKMINNGSKGQYILRSKNTLTWRGIASVKIPSFYTSSTDWRNGKVDKDQRRGEFFRAASDGRVWDAPCTPRK